MVKFTEHRKDKVNTVFRRVFMGLAVLFCVVFSGITQIYAQDKNDQDAIKSGSNNVLVNGKKAQRAGDISADDAIYSTNVFKNGKPAIIGCKTGIPITSPNVFINGKPAVLGCKKMQ